VRLIQFSVFFSVGKQHYIIIVSTNKGHEITSARCFIKAQQVLHVVVTLFVAWCL
jgi:hypothetical protein